MSVEIDSNPPGIAPANAQSATFSAQAAVYFVRALTDTEDALKFFQEMIGRGSKTAGPFARVFSGCGSPDSGFRNRALQLLEVLDGACQNNPFNARIRAT